MKKIKSSKRRLPIKRSNRQKLIIKAVDDFFGEGISQKEGRLKKDIALWLMGRKKGVSLTEEQKEAVWYIKNNLGNKTYTQNLL